MSPTKTKPAPTKTEITVIYNGATKTISYQPNEAMQALLEQALNAFSVHTNRHMMGLFTLDNEELNINISVKDAQVKPGDELVLRQSTVRGG